MRVNEMGRFLSLLGALLMIAAVAYMILIVQGPENSLVKQIYESTICQDGEEISQWLGSYIPRSASSSGGRETAFYCVDNEGQERDVSLEAIALIAGGFTIPFILGLILTMVGGGMMMRNRMKSIMQNPFDVMGGTATWNSFKQQPIQSNMTVIDLRDGSFSGGEIPPEKLEKVQQIMSQMGFDNFFSVGGNSLAERLKQVEDARNQGMINEEEYQRLRQAILDDISS